jgi:hypothetical protein
MCIEKVFLAWTCLLFLPALAFSQRMSFLKTDGRMIVNEQGQEVLLGGFNLGNWLLVEPWMIKLSGDNGAPTGKEVF